MTPIDAVRTIGRPIAYHAGLARHVGGVATAIFLGQLMYWDQISKEDLGVYKTSEEWEAETGLSYREQATARKKLREIGLLVETVKRLQHRIYYKLDRDAFNAWISGLAEDESREIGDSPESQFPNDENAIGEMRNAQSVECGKRNPTNDENATRYIGKDYQETTAETTNTTARARSAAPTIKAHTVADLVALGVDEDVAAEFLANRKRKRVALTPLALAGIQREAGKAGWSLNDALRKAVERGWQSVEAAWLMRDTAPQRQAGTSQFDPLAYVNRNRTSRHQGDSNVIDV